MTFEQARLIVCEVCPDASGEELRRMAHIAMLAADKAVEDCAVRVAHTYGCGRERCRTCFGNMVRDFLRRRPS